ncbi:MAG TPA: hypothetical protein PKA55_11640 [Rhodoblastus sp.]|nr:hypothetical protein [Rhodoblastus sp.]
MRGAVFLVGFGLLAAQASAAESSYTKFDWETCRKTGAEDDVVTRRCNGPDGIAVDINSGADAAFVSFGAKGARGETQLGDFYFPKATVEWRRSGGKPLAAILRYDIGKAIGGPFRSALVVYKLEGTASSCIVAIVDGARPGANDRARTAADEAATKFTCGKDAPARL